MQTSVHGLITGRLWFLPCNALTSLGCDVIAVYKYEQINTLKRSRNMAVPSATKNQWRSLSLPTTWSVKSLGYFNAQLWYLLRKGLKWFCTQNEFHMMIQVLWRQCLCGLNNSWHWSWCTKHMPSLYIETLRRRIVDSRRGVCISTPIQPVCSMHWCRLHYHFIASYECLCCQRYITSIPLFTVVFIYRFWFVMSLCKLSEFHYAFVIHWIVGNGCILFIIQCWN